MYISLVRLYLEYAVQFWLLHHAKDLTKLHAAQRRATKIIPYLHNKSYEETLAQLPYLTAYRMHIFPKILAQKLALRLICEVETSHRLIFSLTLTNLAYDQYFYQP